MPQKNIFYEPDWKKKDPSKFWDEDAVTITDARRSKGNEADYVFIVGLHDIGFNPLDIQKRNNLFIAMTRTRGWLHLLGTGNYSIYTEIFKTVKNLKETPDSILFTYHGRQKKIDTEEKTEETHEM
ncbi:MAG: ATP-binding domain-containing protein [Crenarchaeota archaeon]|nr:ATP-binding domain-containing protein [Thermoproteota archaeon]